MTISIRKMYEEAALRTNGCYKGYIGGNALTMYVWDKYHVNTSYTTEARNELDNALCLIHE